jgi:acetoacetyl-[acyl-carrier protein] synthase
MSPLDEEGRKLLVRIDDCQQVLLDTFESMAVQAAGQLPSGFDPAAHYRSLHHPRGLQLAILGASDAVKSMGIDWSNVVSRIGPDEIAVYSSSVMSQLDQNGFGGMLSARFRAGRATSKQLAMGLNTMPADFVNAYVLGSVGCTGGVTGACATFLYNLRIGVEDIRSGRRRVVVVGSTEAPLIPEVMDGYAAMSALATDADLRKLEGLTATQNPDYRRASRPFGENCGFTMAESGQFVVLMADDLAVELGAEIYGAVPGVYINADGHKKSISAPGAGNYITMGKAVGLAKTLLGDDVVRSKSFVQAHGSSTPQNRTTESRILNEVAKAFGISDWPVAAVKAYVGHSLGPASGDQLAASLGVFNYGILPGIKTIDAVANDVQRNYLNIVTKDADLGVDCAQVAFLNSKGFGGNNATATVFSPRVVEAWLEKRLGKSVLKNYRQKREKTLTQRDSYLAEADAGKLNPIYEFGVNMIDEDQISLTSEELRLPGYAGKIDLKNNEGFDAF